MRFLFLTAYYDDNNAISNCLQNIYVQLNEEVEIDIAYLRLYPEKANDSMYNVYNIDDFSRGNNKLTFKGNVKVIYTNNKGFGWFIKVCKYAFFKIVSKIPWFINLKYKLLQKDNYSQIRKLIIENNYQSIISVSYPFSCHYLASRLKKEFPNINWLAYYFDPFFSSKTEKYSFKERLLFEYKTLSNADKLILTKKIYEEFSTSLLQKYLNKSVICEFPNVKVHSSTKPNSSIKFNPNKINCVFIGYIYYGIRSPKYFLDMMALAKQDIVFYVVGTSDFDMMQYKRILGDRLQLVGSVSLDEAFCIMNDADILVNIGNSTTNQLPSKIFDYLSVGKPIVNLCKSKDCPTIEYMEKYPLSLNIIEKETLSISDVQAFEQFCINYKGKKVSFQTIESIYETSTPEYVANQIMKLVR